MSGNACKQDQVLACHVRAASHRIQAGVPVPNVDEAQPDQTSLSGKSRMPALPGAECLVVHLSNPGSQAGEPSVSGLGIGVLAGMSYDKNDRANSMPVPCIVVQP